MDVRTAFLGARWSLRQVRRSRPHQISLHKPAQALRDLRAHAEPALETADRLMQQHAEAVGATLTARAGGLEQRRLERHVDDVGDHGARWEPANVDFERRL